jgi:hypothetical protein
MIKASSYTSSILKIALSVNNERNLLFVLYVIFSFNYSIKIVKNNKITEFN